MKTIVRIWITAVVLISAGLWTIFNYCHGDTGFNLSWPMDGSKLAVNFSTFGPAVWAGVLFFIPGALALILALVLSILVQFLPEKTTAHEDSSVSAKRGILSISE